MLPLDRFSFIICLSIFFSFPARSEEKPLSRPYLSFTVKLDETLTVKTCDDGPVHLTLEEDVIDRSVLRAKKGAKVLAHCTRVGADFMGKPGRMDLQLISIEGVDGSLLDLNMVTHFFGQPKDVLSIRLALGMAFLVGPFSPLFLLIKGTEPDPVYQGKIFNAREPIGLSDNEYSTFENELHSACVDGNVELLKDLFKRGWLPDKPYKAARNIVAYGIQFGSNAIKEFLLDPKLNGLDPAFILYSAIAAKDAPSIQAIYTMMKNNKHDIKAGYLGRRFLTYAVEYLSDWDFDQDIIKVLVESGESLEGGLTVRENPLMLAIWKNSLPLVKYLIIAGANMNSPIQSYGVVYTPLDYAVWANALAIADYLISVGAKRYKDY